ncbi:DUF1289 domain-containing protein [Sandarakinorhabdus sp.]|uniref:DUF1289 domain-containing protein n=1 Tax=Sandarakinorhabdus sp. TaxID=1916663 RepID=UPI00286EAE09|nr:DUF1289 domain-containing protein [Sandarakinorhabdus sp.]
MILDDQPVRSPCINVCNIDARSGWCEGCRRTIDEIMHWPLATEAERRAIIGVLPSRQIRKRLRLPW